ncbi:MAG: phosphoribosyltransferase [Rhodospirillales bacterium 70-18]|nr:MAG: phosphoribosyltransferase [Rhodospirillales bacterium 70-18]
MPRHRRFRDRRAAGQALATALLRFKGQNPVVLALPRGGVPVAWEVAQALAAPLDLVLVRKLGAPEQPELAVGAVAEGEPPEVFVDARLARHLEVPAAYLAAATARAEQEIARRRQTYLAGRPRPEVRGRCAIIVDDGIATGATMRAAIAATRRRGPARLVLAVPVAPADTLAELRRLVDEAVCLAIPAPFLAVGNHYDSFPQLSDEEVIALLKTAPPPTSPPQA